jgi:hypothetical protein
LGFSDIGDGSGVRVEELQMSLTSSEEEFEAGREERDEEGWVARVRA